MNLNELKNCTENGLKWLEKQPSVKEAEVFASANRLVTMRICYNSSIPCNGLEEAKSTEGFGFSIRVLFKNNRNGFAKIDSSLSIDSMKKAFEKANHGSVLDKYFTSLPAQKEKPSKKTFFDKNCLKLNEEKPISLAYDSLNSCLNSLEAKKVFEEASITGELDFLTEQISIQNSNGINESETNTLNWITLTTNLELKQQDVSGMAFDSSTHLKKLNAKTVGEKSIEKAIATRNAKKIESGEYKVVLSRQTAAELFSNIFNPRLDAIDLKASYFINMLGKQVANQKLTINDDALIENTIGSKRISDEGIATGKTKIIEDGRLVNFISDDYFAKKSKDGRFVGKNGFRLGGGGRHYDSSPGTENTNLVIENGNAKDAELIETIKNGIYIGRIWYCYPVHGSTSPDFTATIRGDSYIIKNGKIDSALVPNTCRINDSIFSVMKNVLELSKEKTASLVWGAESVVITPEIALNKLRIERIARELY